MKRQTDQNADRSDQAAHAPQESTSITSSNDQRTLIAARREMARAQRLPTIKAL